MSPLPLTVTFEPSADPPAPFEPADELDPALVDRFAPDPSLPDPPDEQPTVNPAKAATATPYRTRRETLMPAS